MARWTRSIRFRVTATSVVAVTFVLVAASLVIVELLRRQLVDNLDEGLSQRADAIASLVRTPDRSVLPNDEDLLIQIVGPDGRVIESSTNLTGVGPVAPLDPGVRTVRVPARPESFRVVTRAVETPTGAAILLVGVNDDDAREPVDAAIWLLMIMVPLVIALLGLLAWWLTGRTLRPVDRMRQEMATITATNLGQRVQLPDTHDEIDRLAASMNDTLDRLEDAVRRQQLFVADASHELRSPLTRIRSEIDVELQRPDADLIAMARSIRDETIGMQLLVEDLLELARIDAGTTDRTAFERLDLDDVVLREARRIRERGRVQVETDRVSAACVSGDRRQLGRAVRNVLDNAERHARHTVTIDLAEHHGQASLAVSNDGALIDVEQRERIFDRFTRLDDARTRDAGGTGLGLAIAREIVEVHGGSIRLEPDGPTRFMIELPSAK